MTEAAELCEYDGHLVECGMPYDDTRRIAIGQAHGNAIRSAVTVENAIALARTEKRAKFLRAVRRAADELAIRLAEAMVEAKTNGVLKLDDVLDNWTPLERKLIVGELTALGKKTGGMGKAAQQTDALAAVAWRHVKARELPGYIWAGTFSQREASGLMESSGLTCFDFDKVGGSLDEFISQLLNDPLVFWFTRSPSLKGVKVIVRIPDDAAYNPKKYLACWETFERYVKAKYPDVSMAMDQAAKTVSQLCFYPSDPEAPDPMDSYILHPDADLVALHVEGLKAKKNKSKAKASAPASASAESLESKSVKVPARALSQVEGKGGPMDNYTEGEQAATIVDALESLDKWLSELPAGTGEANKTFSSLGYAVGHWCRGVEDVGAAGVVQDKLRALTEAHYARSADVVERAMSSANGEVTLGTLFNMAKAHGDWVPPWSRWEARLHAAKVVGNGDEGESEEERKARLKEQALAYPAQSLVACSVAKIDPDKTLLEDRLLCRGGSALLLGGTGIGKSSALVTMGALWSLGRAALGILPARPLRILIVQAENDAGDLAEMSGPIIKAMKLSPEDREAVHQRTTIVTINDLAGVDFILALEALIEGYHPDLVIADPLNAYLGADPSRTEEVIAFCRRLLNPLLTRMRCGLILCHHTPKTRTWDTTKWKVQEWAQVGAGASDLANWARAVLVLDPTHDPFVYRLIGAKRGLRLGWVDDFDEPVTVKYFTHSKGEILWRPSTHEEIARAQEAEKAKRGGAPQKYTDSQILRPLADSEQGLSLDELWHALQKDRCEIAKSTLSERLKKMEAKGKVEKESDRFVLSFGNQFPKEGLPEGYDNTAGQ